MDKEIVDYCVANRYRLVELIQDVRELMKTGWQPLGGICHSDSGYDQAMVRYA